ncbi:MAG TPA: CHAD domain-containing protein [Reyranella sp.]|jgi:CHAD domain-containing protein|nr:CHAD domain-containing protein [Reyranella sp.]
MASPLSHETAPELAVRRIVGQCRDDLIKYRAIVLKSSRPVGVHQTRVALRRMRAALSLFEDAASSDAARRDMHALAGEAKWLAGECAPARDLHVYLKETARDVPPAVSRVARRLGKLHLERARMALAGPRFIAFEASLAAFVDHRPQNATGRLDLFGRVVLEARADKADKRGHKVASLDGKRLHKLRIAIKKLRYAAEFLRPAFASKDSKAYIEATARLQGALGTLNDREVAGQMLGDIARAARPGEDLEKPLKKLAKQAAAGDNKRRHKLRRAWKRFEKAERFWRA